jgi:hypothetical protein
VHGATPKVYVLTLNWNRAGDTIACMRSVHALSHRNCSYVVCDNASQPESVAALRAWGADLPGGLEEAAPGETLASPHQAGRTVLLHTGGNLGYAGGINVGLRHALAQGDADFVWVLNNDTEVEADALSALLRHVRSDPRIGLCGSTLILHGDRDRVQAFGGAAYTPWRARSVALGAFSALDRCPTSPTEVESHMAYVIGAAMLVTRAFLDQVGLMDERYFLYSEEHDWAHRGRASGYALGWAPGSRVFHKHGATIGTSPDGGSTLSLFYLYRSKVLFTARHYPYWLPTAVLMLGWEAAKLLLKGRPSKAWAAWRGMAAAARPLPSVR